MALFNARKYEEVKAVFDPADWTGVATKPEETVSHAVSLVPVSANSTICKAVPYKGGTPTNFKAGVVQAWTDVASAYEEMGYTMTEPTLVIRLLSTGFDLPAGGAIPAGSLIAFGSASASIVVAANFAAAEGFAITEGKSGGTVGVVLTKN